MILMIPFSQRATISSSPRTNSRSSFTTVLNPNDVLLGRGVPVFTYSGNVRFRQLAHDRKGRYASSRKREIKNELALEIIEIITQRGGRFLREIIDPLEASELGVPRGTKAWAFVDDNTILQKVKQAMREPDNQQDGVKSNRNGSSHGRNDTSNEHSKNVSNRCEPQTSSGTTASLCPNLGNESVIAFLREADNQLCLSNQALDQSSSSLDSETPCIPTMQELDVLNPHHEQDSRALAIRNRLLESLMLDQARSNFLLEDLQRRNQLFYQSRLAPSLSQTPNSLSERLYEIQREATLRSLLAKTRVHPSGAQSVSLLLNLLEQQLSRPQQNASFNNSSDSMNLDIFTTPSGPVTNQLRRLIESKRYNTPNQPSQVAENIAQHGWNDSLLNNVSEFVHSLNHNSRIPNRDLLPLYSQHLTSIDLEALGKAIPRQLLDEQRNEQSLSNSGEQVGEAACVAQSYKPEMLSHQHPQVSTGSQLVANGDSSVEIDQKQKRSANSKRNKQHNSDDDQFSDESTPKKQKSRK